MNIASDSLASIFDALAEGALTLQQGGGVGYDFSILRPKGDSVKQAGTIASGPVAFMRIWDTSCSVLLTTGARRGAMMGVLRCDHPDILEFITAKENPSELRHFNVSVMVSDAFMTAVKEDAEWPLVFPIHASDSNRGEIVYRQWGNSLTPVACKVYRCIKARFLWEKIIRSAYEYAEPGVLFSDTINRMNNLAYKEHIQATNPCGEIPLPPYGACNLGSINLTQLVVAPFTANAALNWARLEEITHIATRFLDDVITVSRYPLNAERHQALGTRRIGLGLTGFADSLVMLGIQYNSPAAAELAGNIMKKIAEVTWLTSIELAQEKRSFPFFHADYLEGAFVKNLDPSIYTAIKRYGIRNSHHNAIAPTGTISLLAHNVSNGIEPIFKAEYNRRVRSPDNAMLTLHVKDYAFSCWQEQKHPGLPPAWIDTDLLSPADHLRIQGAMQPYVDNAISKTINLPKDFPFEKVANIYSQAYQLGLKGCTLFRPNPITGSILEASQENCCPHEGIDKTSAG